MSRRTAAAVAVLVLALVLAPITAGQVAAQQSGSVIGEPQLTASTSSGALTPGTTTDVSLSITNRGQIRRGGPEEHESQVTTARGTILRVDSGDTPIEVNTGAIAVGNVPTGTVDAGRPEAGNEGAGRLAQDVRVAVGRADGGDDRVVARGEVGHHVGVGGVALGDVEGRVVDGPGPRDAGDRVAAVEEFRRDAPADVAARAEEQDVHEWSPWWPSKAWSVVTVRPSPVAALRVSPAARRPDPGGRRHSRESYSW